MNNKFYKIKLIIIIFNKRLINYYRMDFSLAKDNKQNIKMFQNIEQQERYSKFSVELNRVFGDLSYEKFYDNLVHQKHCKSQNFFNIFDNSNKKKQFEEDFNIKKFKQYLKNLNDEENKRIIKLANYKKKLLMEGKVEYPKKKSKEKNKENVSPEIKIPEVPDIGKYNPNYSLIRRAIPNVYISRTEFNPKIKYKQEGREIFREKNYNSEGNLNTSTNFESQLTTKSNSNLGSRNSSKIFDSSLTTNYEISSRNNHALKFENYTKRRPLVEDPITKNILNTLELKSTCSPKYVRCSVKFDRMPQLPESPFPECNIEKGCPPLGMYRPNYTSIYNEAPNTYIKRHPVISKKFQLKKLIYKYQIPKEYLMVTSLNKKNKKKEV